MLLFPGFRTVAQENETPDDHQLTFMLYGASFAIPQNGWFEIACENMGAKAINKAVSGEAIMNDAKRMDKGTNYTTADLDEVDVLVLMHVHNQNVANEEYLKEYWEDYDNVQGMTNYAQGYDYVIKRYMADCAALETNPDSKWYGVEGGKPAKIMLCTHWHDSRTTYNTAIRTLAEKWNFPLVEFDTHIGFSKDDEGLTDPGEPSRNMAHDTETINNVKYGWHPKRGNNSPIQNRMAAIFTKAVEDAYGLTFPFEMRIKPLSEVVLPGEDAKFMVSYHNGMFPYSFSGNDFSKSALEGRQNLVTIEGVTANTALVLDGTHQAWGDEDPATSTAGAYVLVTDGENCFSPDFDSYVNELSKSSNYDGSDVIQLKYAVNAKRNAYVAFQASELMNRSYDKVILRLYFKDYTPGVYQSESGRPQDAVEYLSIKGNTSKYNGQNIKWDTEANRHFEDIKTAGAEITQDMKGSYVSIDVTDWALNTLESLEKTHGNKNTGHLTFRISVEPNDFGTLMNFYSTEGAAQLAPARRAGTTNITGPQLLFAQDDQTVLGIVKNVAVESNVTVKSGTVYNPANEPVAIYNTSGMTLYKGTQSEISLSDLPRAIYLINTPSRTIKYRAK